MALTSTISNIASGNPFIAIAGKHGITSELRIIPEIRVQMRRSKTNLKKYYAKRKLIILRKTKGLSLSSTARFLCYHHNGATHLRAANKYPALRMIALVVAAGKIYCRRFFLSLKFSSSNFVNFKFFFKENTEKR